MSTTSSQADRDEKQYRDALRRLATSDRATAPIYAERYRRLYEEEPEP